MIIRLMEIDYNLNIYEKNISAHLGSQCICTLYTSVLPLECVYISKVCLIVVDFQ